MTQREHGILTAKNLAVIMRGFCIRDFPEGAHISARYDGVWTTVTIEKCDKIIYSGHTVDGKEWTDDTGVIQNTNDRIKEGKF